MCVNSYYSSCYATRGPNRFGFPKAGLDMYSVKPAGVFWHRVCGMGGRMRVHSSVRAVAIFIAFALLTPLVSAQEPAKEARYKFKKGDILKYEVTSSLDASMVGSNPDFLTGGNDHPLTWTVN